MKGFYLYFLLSMLTGNPILAIVLVLIIYFFIDRYYLRFLPDFSRMFRANREIRSNLRDIQINPQNARAAYALGVLYFERKKYKEAIKYLEHPRLKNDNTPGYLSYLGMTEMELGRNEEGKSNIQKALETDPRAGYGLPYIYLIKNAMNEKSPDRNTINTLEQKVGRFANTENLYRLGMMYKKSGDRGKANEFFSKALTEYSYCPRGISRLHRKWAILSRINKII
jgi:tetratricopeptide (TPR) repeat protein